MGMQTKWNSAGRQTGIFGGNNLIMEQTIAKGYILYNEVTNEYLTRVTFMGSTVYKTTTLDLAMRFSEQDKENLEAMGAGNPEKVLNNIEATAFGNDSDVKETYRLSNLSFLSINDLTPEERAAFDQEIEEGKKKAARIHCCRIVNR
jgi:sporulation-control protein spo0M